MRNWIKDVWLAMEYSLRLLLAGKQTVLLLLVSLVLLTAMLAGMDEVKEEKSKIVIGMVNEDGSSLAEEIIASMGQKDLYQVVTGEEKELTKALKRGELSAVCVLKEGLAEAVAQGKTNHLVTIYETKNKSALLLSDILAGIMMQEICTAKSYQTFCTYAEKTARTEALSIEEYRDFVKKLSAEDGLNFSFDVTYMADGKTAVEKPSQAVVYEQAIFAVFALMAGLISIYSVLPFRQMHHGRLADRMKTLPVRGSALYAGGILTGLVIPMLFGGSFFVCLSLKNSLEFSKIISLLVCTAVYICVIVCMMLLAAYGIRNDTVYQMGMLAMILVFGVFGLISLADGLLVPEGMAAWVPNGWYVRKITELYHQ